ncbi:MAG: hypothetical protein QM734_10180 [Cyclobacteriaceae bacterium]
MNLSDFIGSLGVAILLIAYLLNLLKKISAESISYILMNLIGAGLACLASVLIEYTPFIILEAAWILVSLISLIRLISRKKTT